MSDKSIWIADKVVVTSVTKYCQNNCDYCIAQRSKVKTHLDFERAYHILNWLGQDGWMIEFTGGEPLAVPGFVSFANKLARAGNHVVVLSNGYQAKAWEQCFDDRIGLFFTWHPTQIKIEDFYYYSTRSNTDYQYIIHPRSLANGQFERDKETLKIFSKPVYYGFFEGIWQGKDYSLESEIYKPFAQYFQEGFLTPRRNLCIERNGLFYRDYEFTKPLGPMEEIRLAWANTIEPLNYIDVRKKRVDTMSKEDMVFDDDEKDNGDWCVSGKGLTRREIINNLYKTLEMIKDAKN